MTFETVNNALSQLSCLVAELPPDVQDAFGPVEAALLKSLMDLANRNEYLQRQHADRERLIARLSELCEAKDATIREQRKRLEVLRRRVRRLWRDWHREIDARIQDAEMAEDQRLRMLRAMYDGVAEAKWDGKVVR